MSKSIMVCQELLSENAKGHADEVSASVIFEHFNQNQELKQLVITWFIDAKKMRSCQYPYCFDAFTTLWRTFNGWAECISKQKRDRLWIDSLMLNQRLQETFSQLLKDDDQFCANANLFMAQWPIFKSSAIHSSGISWAKGNRPEVALYYLENKIPFEPKCWKIHKGKNEETPLDWPHTLAVLYGVRNNLIHGAKAKSEENHEIVSSAFHVLFSFLEKSSLFE